MVPQSKRQAGFDIFNATLGGHADNIKIRSRGRA